MDHGRLLLGLTGREDAVVIRAGSQSVDSLAAVHGEHVSISAQSRLASSACRMSSGMARPLSPGCGLVEHDPSVRQYGTLAFGSRGKQDGSDTECLPHTGGCDGGVDRRWRS